MKNWIHDLFMPHKQNPNFLLLQVARTFYIDQVLIPPAYKFLNFFIWNIKFVNFPNIHFSIFHLYLLLIIKFPFNVLTFYFQTIHFLLPFSKSQSFSILFLNFSFHYFLNKTPSFFVFLIYITLMLRNAVFWHKWLNLV